MAAWSDSRMNTRLGRTFGAASGRLDSWELLVVENGLEWTERDQERDEDVIDYAQDENMKTVK